MPIDVANDELIELSTLAKRFPNANGKPKSLKSMMRWVLNGVRGTSGGKAVKLEAKRVGGTWYTTEDAIRRFADSTTRQSLVESQIQPKRRSATPKSSSHRRAMAKLKARGMCKGALK